MSQGKATVCRPEKSDARQDSRDGVVVWGKMSWGDVMEV